MNGFTATDRSMRNKSPVAYDTFFINLHKKTAQIQSTTFLSINISIHSSPIHAIHSSYKFSNNQ
jgi:hypothetical protein